MTPLQPGVVMPVLARIEFCLLGPLLVRADGAAVPVPSAKLRTVLAALLLNAGQVVPVDGIAEILWGPAPPPSARVSVQNHVMRLRRALGEAGRDRIATQPPGYLIRVDPDELDLTRFEAMLAATRAAARDGSWDQAAAHAFEALALWRGEPLADVDSELLAMREVPRLAELRLQAAEARIDANLHLGRHAEVITELQKLTGTHPLRERLHGLLMLALYRDGRQAEALAAYQQARQVLVEELGTEPGAGLRQLHHQILAADPALDSAGTEQRGAGGPGQVVPRQLPATVRHFTGRSRELAELSGLLGQADQDRPGTVVISAIGGTAGVGKTALAVYWAHKIAGRFPDGQLYVNLRGYDPGQPMRAADALAGFLRALGVPGQEIPPEEDQRAARYRSILADRQMLVVLDNAGSVEQVRPLLPGSPACAVLVTSRDALTGLVVRDGATRLDLDLLPPADAVRLLRELIGDRVKADPYTAAELTAQCSRLPLALRIAAELAANRPAAPLASLVGELTDQRRRLDLLDVGGDPRTAVRAVFSWSYWHLDTDAARTFRLLGLHPGTAYDLYAAAALTGTTPEQGREKLDALSRAHLIQTTAPGRYSMHDLLRAYARELAAVHDGEDEQQAALTRLFDHYLYTAANAMDTLHPAERHRRPRVPTPATAVPPVTDLDAARTWLDAERAILVAVTVHTSEYGWPAHATRLGATLFRYLDAGSHYPEAITIHTHAWRAACRTGDRAAEASSLTRIGVVDWRQGRYQQATSRFSQALALCRETGDRTSEANALGNLGMVQFAQGLYQQATDYYQRALALCREIGERTTEARILGNLGVVVERQGHHQQAIDCYQQTLALCRESGYRTGEASALGNLGAVYRRQGHYQQAIDYLQENLALCRETGDRTSEANALADLGYVYLQQGHHQQATGYLRAALALCRETGNLSGEAETINGIGEVLLAAGQPGDARTQHTIALGLASQIGEKYEQARAHNGLGHSCQAIGEADLARRHWQQALAIYTELGAPEAGQVRAQLTAVENNSRQEREESR